MCITTCKIIIKCCINSLAAIYHKKNDDNSACTCTCVCDIVSMYM